MSYRGPNPKAVYTRPRTSRMPFQPLLSLSLSYAVAAIIHHDCIFLHCRDVSRFALSSLLILFGRGSPAAIQNDVELEAVDPREGPLRGPRRERRAEAQGLGKPRLHPDHQDAGGLPQGILPGGRVSYSLRCR